MLEHDALDPGCLEGVELLRRLDPRHQAERKPLAAGGFARVVELRPQLAAFLERGERRVVLVRPARRELEAAGTAAAADDERWVRLLHRLRQRVEVLHHVVLAAEAERPRLPRAV